MNCNLPKVWDDNEWLTVNPERISPVQESVNNYLKSAQKLYQGKKILHIGIGSSSIFKEFNSVFGQIDGITNSQQELEMGKNDTYRIYLMNKYNPDEFSTIDSDYDVIVDVSLKSYACCSEHWVGFMKEVINKLKVGGRLLSHTGGFGGHLSPFTTFDNSMHLPELYDLIQLDCSLFEIKFKYDEKTGYYPFIIEKV